MAHKAARQRPVVYLTFDDGPIPEQTPWVLDLPTTWHQGHILHGRRQRDGTP